MRTARVAVLAGLAAIGTLLGGAPAYALICGDTILDVGEACDDGNVVGGDCCDALCQFELSGDPCTDGNACTQTDQCDGAGICVGSNPVVCTALDQCHDVGTCDTGTGICSNPPTAAGVGCNDSNACTQTDQCDGAGTCVGANPVICTALDQCHDVGTCDTGTGICSNPPTAAGVGCNDSNACTQTDQCDGAGTCVGANPVICTALDQCHDVGTCDTGTGICSNPPTAAGVGCNDSNACTQTDQCNGSGTCVGANPVICTALDQCHDVGTCNTGTGICSNPPTAAGVGCNDSNACTQTDQCNGSGTCVGANPVVCTALDQCHDVGTCNTGTGICSNPPTAAGVGCNDSNACTQTDQCNGSGTCVGANPVVCTALDQCHDVGTCNTGTGICSNPPTAAGVGCNDSNACTQTDQCNGSGTCVGANPVVCTALDQCHDVGTCDTGTGICSNPPTAAGVGCNDSNACTQTDQCNGSGTCVGANPVICTALDQCHDVGTCDTGTGICSNPPTAAGVGCNDSNACTQTDQCNGSGTCVGANPVVCTALDQCHDIGTCNTGTGVCSNPPKAAGATCADGNACTQTDQCNGSGTCVGGNPVICTALDQCHVAGTCDTGTGLCSNPNQPDGTPCNDGAVCTIADQCVGGTCGGNAQTCGDGTTQGSCGEQCDDANLINGDGCDNNCLTTGCGNGVVTAGEQCDDGNAVGGDGCSLQCLREFLNPVPAAGDHYGESVAMLGTNLVVGAPLHDEPNAINTGIAYLMSGATGAMLRQFNNPSPNPGDRFGDAVATVGVDVAVGAPLDDTAGADAGAVYLYDGNTGALLRTFLNPSPGTNDHFGASLAAFGSNLLIGAPIDLIGLGGGGIAYLYNAATGTVIQVFLNPSPSAGDEFGIAVAGAGSQVLVGAPRHDEPAQGQLPGCNDCGAAYVFNPVNGALIRKINNPSPSDGDLFGRSATSLGTNWLIGAPVIDGSAVSSGAAYLMSSTTGAVIQQFFSPTPTLNDEFGISIAAVGTDKVVVGARRDDASPFNLNTGSAFLFHAASGSYLQTITKATPVSDDQFGAAVASVGSRIFVGTPLDDAVELDAGAVYSFEDTSCGNGALAPGEQCDDGNTVNGDGCDANCRFTGCGNGIISPGEACDDGNTTAGDGCSPTCASEGVCGDGITASFEGCDDGNLVNGDGCDANCTPTACGNGIQTAGEACDHGANNGIDLCCSTTCQITDGDGDGVCDQGDNCPTVPNAAQSNGDGDVFGDTCDICPGDTDNDSDDDFFCLGPQSNPPAVAGGDPCSRANGAGDWIKPKALVGRAGPPVGDEKIRLKGFFTIGTTLPHIAPERYGVQIRVADRFGDLLGDEHIPGGLYTKANRVGWKDPGENAKKWIFQDKTEVAQHNGIRKFVVKDLSRVAPGRIGVFMKAKGSSFPLVSIDQPPVRVTIELNDTALPAGGTPGRDQCGEVAFGLPPLRPSCAFAGTNLICK